MNLIFSFLAAVVGIYSILIFIRIIFSWFRGSVPSKPVVLLSMVTDPYLNWWRNKLNLRLGVLDLSPLAGIAALTVAQSILSYLSIAESISVGVVIAILLRSVWAVAAFIFGFCFILIALRLIAHLTNRDMYGHFWRVIDTVSKPILHKISNTVFAGRITDYTKGLILSLVLLGAIWLGGGFIIPRLANLIAGLPV